jgi:hypothetical protein
LIGVSSWMPLPSPCGAHVGELFGLARIDRHVVGAGVFADDHAGVNGLAGADEEAAAFLDIIDREAGGDRPFPSRRARRVAGGDFARFGPYSLKRWLMMPSPRVRLTRSVSKPMRPRVGMTAWTETNGVVVHVGDFALAVGEVLEDVAELVGGRFDVERSMGSSTLPLSSLWKMTSGRETMTSKPSRRICSTRMAICISPRALISKRRRVGVGELDADVGAGLADEAVAMWRAVRSLPSRPASGESLTTNCILIVGGSMSTKGSGRRSSESVRVSPMKTSSKPARPTMLPALAC